jgi:hypothetical protein
LVSESVFREPAADRMTGMNRRSFFSRLGQAVAGAVLAAHVDFGSLLPVQEVVQMKYRQLGLSTMYTTFLLPDESIRYGMSPLEKAWEAIDSYKSLQEAKMALWLEMGKR